MGSRSKNSQMIPRLLVRLLMQSGQRGGRRTRAEAGYSLAVALIAAFVLLLGVGAVASRGQLGFVGQVFQAQNRQARNVAESAIAEFADTLNREENRFLLIANNSGSDWNNVNNRNHCLAFNDNQSPISGRDPKDPATLPTISTGVVTRFSQGNGFQALRPLDPNPTARQFRVETIEHLNATRTGQIDRQSLLSAADRGLIRVTMIGRVDLGNGRVSEARVAREFEVVPKCCNRSFGGNAAVNWGRDREACAITGVSQFRVSLSGGPVDGKGNAITVRDGNNNPVTQAVCWNGSDGSDPGNVLTRSVNPECAKTISIAGKPDGTTFSPAKFDYNPPPYASSAPADYLSQVTGTEQPQNALNVLSDATLQMPQQNKDYYIYFDDDPAVNNLRVCEANKSGGVQACTLFPTDSNGNQVCYRRIRQGSGARAPYNEVNCRLRNIVTGNQIIYVDTSKARINFFFDNKNYTGELMGGGGNSTFQRVHCRWGQSGYYGGTYNSTTRCNQDLLWSNPPSGNDFQQKCKTDSGDACGLTKSDGSLYNSTYFDVSELFNIYSSSPGSFDLNGTASTIGFNLYAPFSNLTIKGGGQADPNFMGRLWVNGFEINGSVSIRLPSSPPSGFEDGLKGALWDFRVRSFTQASGF